MSHFRGGVMIPSVSAGGMLTLTSTTFWRNGSLSDTFPVAGIDEGGNPSIPGLGAMTDVGNFFGLAARTYDTSDSRFTKVTQQHQRQLPGPGLYSISASSGDRVGGIRNAFESTWELSAQVFWDGANPATPIGFNFSAVQPEVVRGSDYSGNLSAVPGPGLQLSYDQALNLNIFAQPPGFTVNAATGALFIPAASTASYQDNFQNVGADYAFSGNIFARDAAGNLRGRVEFDWMFDAVNTGPVNRAPTVNDANIDATVGDACLRASV